MQSRPSFTSETAKEAAAKSAASRRAREPKTAASNAFEDLLMLKSLLMEMLSRSPCEHCKRTGPRTHAEYMDTVKTLLTVNTEIINRVKGKPPTESTAHRFGSVEEYKKAVAALDALDP